MKFSWSFAFAGLFVFIAFIACVGALCGLSAGNWTLVFWCSVYLAAFIMLACGAIGGAE